jgi:hypothetical protein
MQLTEVRPLKREENLKAEQRFRLRDLLRYNLKTVRAYLRAFPVNLTALPNFRLGRKPVAIRTGTSTTWLHRWAMYSRMCSGPSWSGEREILRQLHADVVRAKRLSHDQPIVFSRP